MTENAELEVLLSLDGTSYEAASGYVVEFTVRRTERTSAPPNQPPPSSATIRKALQKFIIDGEFRFPYSLPFAIMHSKFVGRFGGKYMARAMGRLTALKVSRSVESGMYADGGGLCL
jgi:hypothetical protein